MSLETTPPEERGLDKLQGFGALLSLTSYLTAFKKVLATKNRLLNGQTPTERGLVSVESARITASLLRHSGAKERWNNRARNRMALRLSASFLSLSSS